MLLILVLLMVVLLLYGGVGWYPRREAWGNEPGVLAGVLFVVLLAVLIVHLSRPGPVVWW